MSALSNVVSSMVKFNDDRTVMRHRLNSERAYMIAPAQDADEAASKMSSKLIMAGIFFLVISFLLYSLLSNHLFGDAPSYRSSPEMMIYGPALVCGIIATYLILRYINIMYRDPAAVSIPVDLADYIDEDNRALLFLAHQNGELTESLSSLREAVESDGSPETFDGPSERRTGVEGYE